MAINYLNSVDLNQNELIKAQIENQPNDASAGTGVEGQLYYDTTLDVLKVWAGGSWSEVGGGVETITTTDGTYIDLTPNSATSGAVTVTADLSATGTANSTTYLRGDNSWATIPTPDDTTYDLLGIGSTNGTAGVTLDGSDGTLDNVLIIGAGTSTVTRSGNTLTVTSNDEFDGTVTSVAATHAGDAFTASIGNVSTVNPSVNITMNGASTDYIDGEGNLTAFPNIPQGDITGIDEGNYIQIDDATGPVPTINALGTTSATASRLVARDSSGYGYVVTPASGDSSTKIATTAFVQSSLTGLLEFKGGFNASTGAIVGGGNLTSGSGRVAVEVGDYYVVTADGDFFGNAATPLTIGDSVIVQTAAATGASVEGDFIVVQSDTDLATLTTVGIGNVNAGTGISVAYSSGTATVTNTETNTSNTFADTIIRSKTVSHNLGTKDVIVQLYDLTTNETVYADVDRSADNDVTITFSSQPPNSIRVLVQKIG